RRRHTRFSRDWSSDVCSSDLGSGKTTLSTALSHLTGLPRTHGSPMREPIGGEGRSVHNWTDGQLMQLTVNRFAERLLGEAAHPEIGRASWRASAADRLARGGI